MAMSNWRRRTCALLAMVLVLQLANTPLYLGLVVRRALRALEGAELLEGQAASLRSVLENLDGLVPVEVSAAEPLLHDPGDTASLNELEDTCCQGQTGGSLIEYNTRALTMGMVLGTSGPALALRYDSGIGHTPIPLTAWVPTGQPIASWSIAIEGWRWEGEGAHPLAFWDATNRDTGEPVPAGLYYFEVTYTNELGTGSTSHPVLVQRDTGSALGRGWAHGYEMRVREMDAEHLVLDSMGFWQLYTRNAAGDYVSDCPYCSTLRRTTDGWTLEQQEAGGPRRVTFDGDGRATEFMPADGRGLTLSYSGDRLVELAGADGLRTRLTYDGDLLTGVEEASGARWTLAYSAGLLASLTDPLGAQTTFAYDDAGLLTAKTDPLGHETRYLYDETGAVAEVQHPAGGVTRYATQYHTEPYLVENPAAQAPDLGTTTVTFLDDQGAVAAEERYTFDDRGKVTRMAKSPDGGTTWHVWKYRWGWEDQSGLLLAAVDPTGAETQYEYLPGTALVTRMTSPRGATVRLAYRRHPVAGWLLSSVTRGSEATTHMEYDAAGRLTHVTQGKLGYFLVYGTDEGPLATRPTALVWGWDGKGDALTAEGADRLRYAYDDAGRLIELTDALGGRTRLTYDENGRLVATTDAAGRTSRYVYDALGRVVENRDAAGGVTRYAYDAAGNLERVTDANGNATTLAYDAENRMVARTDALGRSWQWEYDALGRLAWRADPSGSRADLAYDGMGRPTTIAWSDGQIWRSTFDALGRVTSVATPDVVTTYLYDADGHLVQTGTFRNGTSAAVTYRYDAQGRQTAMETSDGYRVTYGYGSYGELQTIQSPLGSARLTYEVDRLIAPRLSTVRLGGLTTRYTYDVQDRLVEKVAVHDRWEDGQSVILRYTYDAVGNVVSAADGRGEERYAYDALDRLIRVSGADGATTTYTYDAVGNRTKSGGPRGTVTYRYDAANQLLSAGGTAYEYDPAGRLVSAAGGGAERTYQWDARGRLVGVVSAEAGAASSGAYTYGPTGERLVRTTGDATEQATYDGYHVVETRDAEGSTATRTLTGSGWDNALAVQTAQGEIYTLVADVRGATVAAVDHTGSVVDAPALDVWGAPESTAGEASAWPGFQGRPYDAESGLYAFRARYYDPTVGRFISPDPLVIPNAAGTLNPYVFGLNNPLRYSDPTGTILVSSFVIAGALIGAALYGSYRSASYVFSTPADCRTVGDFAIELGKGVLIGGTIGAISGAFAGMGAAVIGAGELGALGSFGVGAFYGTGGGAGAGMAGSTLGQLLDTGSVDLNEVARSGVIGAIAGGVTGGLGSGLLPYNASMEFGIRVMALAYYQSEILGFWYNHI